LNRDGDVIGRRRGKAAGDHPRFDGPRARWRAPRKRKLVNHGKNRLSALLEAAASGKASDVTRALDVAAC
jgi:hypothetical protein